MASVFRRKTKDGKFYRLYYLSWIDEWGVRHKEKGYTDKAATLAKAQRLEKEASRRREGLPTVNEIDQQRLWNDAVDLFVADLDRQGCGKMHTKNASSSLKRLGAWLKWRLLKQARVDGLTRYLAHRQAQGLAPRTVNADRDFLVQFGSWCVLQSWMTENPFQKVPKAKVGAKGKRRRRRAYTRDEIMALFAVIPENRRLVYQVAATSGLRRIELERIEWRDIDLTNPGRPLWRLREVVSKNSKAWTVPMAQECAEVLRQLGPGPRTEKVFQSIPRIKTLNRDLKRAGIIKVDEEGRSIDFHCLRYYFCTQLARTMPIQHVRILMRHLTLRQTCDLYCDLGLDDVGEEVWQLEISLLPNPLPTA